MDIVRCASTEYRTDRPLGNYCILRYLGKGGNGTVYLGQHQYLKSLAAIKIAHKQAEGSDQQRLLAEARIAAHLVHPHIIRLLEFGIDQEQAYLIMDYAPNSTMGQRYPSGTKLSPLTVAQRIREVSTALDYMHSKNLIHCDVKPANMLLGSDDRILLCDFGIACYSHKPTSGQLVFGSLSYMAPEQLMGHPCFASDQYALAIVAYEWLCGELPFKGSRDYIALQHITASPPSLRSRVATLTPAIEEVILMALSKQPEQRFASIEVFAEKFAEACSIQNKVVAFYLPPDNDQNRIVLPAQQDAGTPPAPRRSRNRMATPKEIIKMLLLNISIGVVMFILLSALGIPTWTFKLFIMLCLTVLPLSIYMWTKQKIMIGYAVLSLLIAFILGFGFQSATFFEFVYVILYYLGAAVHLAVYLRRTRDNQR